MFSLVIQVLLLTMFLCVVPMTWQLIFWTTGDCGPFQNLSRAYCVISSSISSLPSGAKAVFQFIGTVGFCIPAILVLALLAYMLRYRQHHVS
jgi:uncharacterized membrane protein